LRQECRVFPFLCGRNAAFSSFIAAGMPHFPLLLRQECRISFHGAKKQSFRHVGYPYFLRIFLRTVTIFSDTWDIVR
jgi:hypothetical protein